MLLVNQFVGFGAGGADGGNDAFTKWLAHGEGADASTTITDSSAGAHTFTANGNAQIDTAQFKFGAASILFDGTGDYLTGDGHADFAFGTGDFTVDFWVRPNSVTGAQILIDFGATGGAGAQPLLYTNGANLLYRQGGSDRITGTATLTTGAWFHIAFARSGTSTKLFVNGTQDGSTYSDSTNYTIVASRPILGINSNDLTNNPYSGWMDEFRISKGVARWTANFTPPTVAYF